MLVDNWFMLMESTHSPQIPDMVLILNHFRQLNYHLFSKEWILVEDNKKFTDDFHSSRMISILIGGNGTSVYPRMISVRHWNVLIVQVNW